MRFIQTIATGAAAIVLLAAGSASALAVTTGLTGSTGVDVGSASSSGSAGTGVTVDVSGQGSSSSSSSDMTSSSSGSISTGASADLSIPLIVTQADVASGAVPASNVTPEAVQTKDDLSGYIAAQIQSDTNLTGVDTASDHVAVTYKEPAMLFGFIPVTVDTTATTDASGNVSISYPWWSFLTATNQSNLQANLDQSVSATLGDNATTSGSAQLSASEQAELVATIESVMQSEAQAQGSASVQTSASSTASVQ